MVGEMKHLIFLPAFGIVFMTYNVDNILIF
ncbi:hypothetical protein CLV98_102331 [Dyadobacter jejuensis]|uniref:Uncharacterized protein n=1 Tax=Dyadobacter jejuensis TaxID=1082580 RepID=A0A316BAC6_9BACT|nr:hypothetical protein CLV98_102331 [Dyadobacter jejuensis]